MNLLAIEASGSLCSVALRTAAGVSERTAAPGTSPSEQALPLAQALLRAAGLAPADLDALAFGAGPGSFTGVRLACGLAQGLALAARCPVIAVGSLEALALEAGTAQVMCCVDARMGEIYVAAYRCAGDAVDCLIEPAVLPPEQVPALPGAGPWTLAGNALAAYRERLPAGFAQRFAAHHEALAHARSVLRLAPARARLGAAQAAPLYVRDKVALTVGERRARGGRA